MPDPYEALSEHADRMRNLADSLYDRMKDLRRLQRDFTEMALTSAALEDSMRELATFAADLEHDRSEAERMMGDANALVDLVPDVDESDALKAIIEMALDVERGIRDPEELTRLIHDHSPLAL